MNPLHSPCTNVSLNRFWVKNVSIMHCFLTRYCCKTAKKCKKGSKKAQVEFGTSFDPLEFGPGRVQNGPKWDPPKTPRGGSFSGVFLKKGVKNGQNGGFGAIPEG